MPLSTLTYTFVAIPAKLFELKAAVRPPGLVLADCRTDEGSCRSVAFALATTNWSAAVRLKAIPLYARPLSGAPVTLPERDANGEVLELKGFISVTEVRLLVAISTETATSQREMTGAQWVADPWGGLELYVKNQNTIGRNKLGVPVFPQSGITSVPIAF
jgi:hypothetical protein